MKRRSIIKRHALQTKCIPDYLRRSMCLVLVGMLLILEAGVCALLLLRFTFFSPLQNLSAKRDGSFTQARWKVACKSMNKLCTWKQFGFRKKLEQLPYSSSSCFETLREDPQPVLWTCECKWRDTGRLGATSSPARLFVVTWSKLCCQSVSELSPSLNHAIPKSEVRNGARGIVPGRTCTSFYFHSSTDGKSASQSMKWWKARHDDINPINLSCWVFQHLDIWIGRPQPEAVSSRSYSTVGPKMVQWTLWEQGSRLFSLILPLSIISMCWPLSCFLHCGRVWSPWEAW